MQQSVRQHCQKNLFPCDCHCSLITSILYLYLLRRVNPLFSVHGAQSAFMCTCSNDNSGRWTAGAMLLARQMLEICEMGKPVNCVSHLSRTRCPAPLGPRHRGFGGRSDGWTCALFHCSTPACRSTARALTPAGELQDSVETFDPSGWYLPTGLHSVTKIFTHLEPVVFHAACISDV